MMKPTRILVATLAAAALVLAPGMAASAAGPDTAARLPNHAPASAVITQLAFVSTISGSVQVEGAGGLLTPYRGDVTLIDTNDPSNEQLTLTGDGTFQFAGLPAGSYQIRLGGIMTSLDPERSLVPETYWPGVRDQALADVIMVGDDVQTQLGQITLRQGAFLSGRVLMNDAGSLVAAPSIVSLWKWDPGTGYYMYHSEKANDELGRFEVVVEDGTYAVRARPADETGLGSEWNIDARYFADSTDVVIGQGQAMTLADMVLDPRYFDIWRLAGPDRFGTAVEITRAIYGDPLAVAPPSVIYLTNARNYPDALSAGPAAILQGGAILPVEQNGAPEVILAEIARLKPDRIVIMGQENAVSSVVEMQVADRLASVGASVPITRNGGASRYETAEMLIRSAFEPLGSQYAFIVTGQNYPDALAAGAAAGRLGAPVILVPGSGADLPASTAALLADLGVTHVLIAGGPTTVSPGIEADLRALAGLASVERFAGADRYQTAAMINAAVFNGSEYALLASGMGFADALAGGPLAGVMGAPLYLTPQHCVPDDPFYQLWDQDVKGVQLLGGLPSLGIGVEELASC
jgi:putative cell wall-binding protein